MNKKDQELELTDAKMDPAILQEIDHDLGKGVSTDAADNLVPLVYILQPLSPQVMDGPAHLEGAKAGDIWLKNFSGNPVISGKTGMWFQPCKMYQKWTEWVPRDRGGGFIASYDYNAGKLPEGAVRDMEEKTRPRFFFTETDNDLVDTRYEAGLVWLDGNPYPYVIPFKSTGHAISRGWMTKRNSLIKRGKISGTWAAWTHLYKLTTTTRTNKQGTWYIFNVGDPTFYMPGFADKPCKEGMKIVGEDPSRAYAMGKALAEAFESGSRIEAPEEFASEDSTGTVIDDKIPY